ncbi:MAG: alpha/beta hydrolase, partial [Rubrivivax sp.]|nr:alpha/beta hydrolase [Pyrinomonadaceae bacterium]
PATGGAAVAGGAAAADREKYLRVGADWFERTSDAELAIALRDDPVRTRALLERTLTREEAAEVVESLEIEPAREGLFWSDPDPELPEIIFLHGILGGHLAHLGWMKNRVWLFPLSFLMGDLGGRLSLSADGENDAQSGQSLQPDGHLRLAYSRASRLWRRSGFVVHEFSFDWRKSVALAADRLHFFIENLHIDRPGKKFVLAAHSMGGLVASLYAQRHPVWADRVQRAVFMGTPLGGSYAPVEAVVGSYPFLQKLAFISRRDDVESLGRMARTQPGLIDMLPNPKLFPDAEQVYSQSRWPGDAAPSQRWLDQSRNLKPLLVQSPLLERTTLLVSLGHGTVSSLVEQDGAIWRGPRTGVGDGTVPAKAAAVEGIPAYKVDYEHSNIPRDPKAIQAVSDLARTGACALERVKPEELSGEVAAPEAPAPEFSEGLAEAVRTRYDVGVFGQDDWDWLTSPEMSSLPKS